MLQMRKRRPPEEETLQGPVRERQGHACRPGLLAPCPREVSHLHELCSRLLRLALQLGDDLRQPGKLPDAPGLELLPALCELLLQLRQLAQQVLLPLPQELVALLKLSHDALPLVLELLLQGWEGGEGGDISAPEGKTPPGSGVGMHTLALSPLANPIHEFYSVRAGSRFGAFLGQPPFLREDTVSQSSQFPHGTGSLSACHHQLF